MENPPTVWQETCLSRVYKRKRDWSTLPKDLLILIADQLDFPDLFRFGCVCRTWRSVCGGMQFGNHLPFLILPVNNNSFSNKVGFYSLCDNKIYEVDIPQLCNRKIRAPFLGGWLMTLHRNFDIQLIKPFSTTKTVHHLPPMTKFPFHFSQTDKDIYKVALSSSLVTNGTVIMAIYRMGCLLEEWSSVRNDEDTYSRIDDITFYKGKFYLVRDEGRVSVVHGLDNDDIEAPYCEKVVGPNPGKEAWNYYILEMSGDLVVVLMYVDVDEACNYDSGSIDTEKVEFKVFKIEFGKRSARWVEIHNLGYCSLFLGRDSSFSLSFGKFLGCKPNHIYFSYYKTCSLRRDGLGDFNFGIFSLEDGRVEKFLPSDSAMLPFWFELNTSSLLTVIFIQFQFNGMLGGSYI